MNFANVLRTPILSNICKWLLLQLMPSESSYSEKVISQWEYEELTSESNPAPIHGCYNNEQCVFHGRNKRMEEKNISIMENKDGRDDATRSANRAWCNFNN